MLPSTGVKEGPPIVKCGNVKQISCVRCGDFAILTQRATDLNIFIKMVGFNVLWYTHATSSTSADSDTYAKVVKQPER